jgi:hypothetical protein
MISLILQEITLILTNTLRLGCSAVETLTIVVNAKIVAAAKSLHQDYILLDTCGGANLFSNPNMLSNS